MSAEYFHGDIQNAGLTSICHIAKRRLSLSGVNPTENASLTCSKCNAPCIKQALSNTRFVLHCKIHVYKQFKVVCRYFFHVGL